MIRKLPQFFGGNFLFKISPKEKRIENLQKEKEESFNVISFSTLLSEKQNKTTAKDHFYQS
ncbi:hypothetical protein DRF65_15910 [Chryseobacterium pennae]|uniref:Uncharacterized protein n=1 Tax=Chryseobacterium pennae TaxID=2258962 RepID=A0A3D9C7F3_9FLAO|nr:hypothetical protein DRF65_15910 [Chryseobacterium pennae]